MTKIRWREVFKFLSGALLAASFMNVYLWLEDVSVPSFGYVFAPRIMGLKGAVQFGLFVVVFYFAWIRE
jgi:hypothetical protein